MNRRFLRLEHLWNCMNKNLSDTRANILSDVVHVIQQQNLGWIMTVNNLFQRVKQIEHSVAEDIQHRHALLNNNVAQLVAEKYHKQNSGLNNMMKRIEEQFHQQNSGLNNMMKRIEEHIQENADKIKEQFQQISDEISEQLEQNEDEIKEQFRHQNVCLDTLHNDVLRVGSTVVAQFNHQNAGLEIIQNNIVNVESTVLEKFRHQNAGLDIMNRNVHELLEIVYTNGLNITSTSSVPTVSPPAVNPLPLSQRRRTTSRPSSAQRRRAISSPAVSPTPSRRRRLLSNSPVIHHPSVFPSPSQTQRPMSPPSSQRQSSPSQGLRSRSPSQRRSPSSQRMRSRTPSPQSISSQRIRSRSPSRRQSSPACRSLVESDFCIRCKSTLTKGKLVKLDRHECETHLVHRQCMTDYNKGGVPFHCPVCNEFSKKIRGTQYYNDGNTPCGMTCTRCKGGIKVGVRLDTPECEEHVVHRQCMTDYNKGLTAYRCPCCDTFCKRIVKMTILSKDDQAALDREKERLRKEYVQHGFEN
jgi:hypothetical protein